MVEEELRQHLFTIRRDAFDRRGVLIFDQLPLFVLLGHYLHQDEILEAIAHAIDDGHGDPEDLDRSDDRQTARLESALLELSGDAVAMSEILTVDIRAGFYSMEMSVFMAHIPGGSLLGITVSDATPTFQVIALGEESSLLELLRDAPMVALPCIFADTDCITVERAIPRRQLPLSRGEVAAVVRTLIGVPPGEGSILREDLLTGYVAGP